jgi:hypothetical protein
MAPGAYKTYAIKAPLSTHHVRATCEEVQCLDYLNGWKVVLDGGVITPELEHAARNSGRHFVEQRREDGVRELVFEAGQPCFRASTHRRPNGRPEIFIRRNGDFRTPRSAMTRFKRPEDWRDDFGEHQERLADQINRG